MWKMHKMLHTLSVQLLLSRLDSGLCMIFIFYFKPRYSSSFISASLSVVAGYLSYSHRPLLLTFFRYLWDYRQSGVKIVMGPTHSLTLNKRYLFERNENSIYINVISPFSSICVTDFSRSNPASHSAAIFFQKWSSVFLNDFCLYITCTQQGYPCIGLVSPFLYVGQIKLSLQSSARQKNG